MYVNPTLYREACFDLTQQIEVSLKDLLNEVHWNNRKFYRHKQAIEERYKLDLESFKKAPNKLEKVSDDDHYAFPLEIKDLFGILLRLYDINPFRGKGKDPLKLTLEDLFHFQSDSLLEIKQLFNTEHQELISHPAVLATEIELNALEDVISKQTILMQILMNKSIETRASFWGFYSNIINELILWIYEMDKYTNKRIQSDMIGFEAFVFSENQHTSLDFIIAHYIRHKSTPEFQKEKSIFYTSMQNHMAELEADFISEDEKIWIDSLWTNEIENMYQQNFKHYITNLNQKEIERHKNKLIKPSTFIKNFMESPEFNNSILNEDEINSLTKYLIELETNTPTKYKKIIEKIYSSIIGNAMDHK
ncbi:hypothetical protein [Lysinibacillus sp. Y5S-8]|uniref:hypothetical protein n=1 Tax=Lysinibacillus sp. Y5S-8 TaxID=3122488 RepID=UPI0030D33039